MKTYAWRRLGARSVDGIVLCFPVLFVMIQLAEAISTGLADSWWGSLVLCAASTASLIITEPFFLSRWGQTPGKYLFGLKVLHKDGSLLGMREARLRTQYVVTQGLALSVKGLGFLTMPFQAYWLWKNKESSWDQLLDTACLMEHEYTADLAALATGVSIVDEEPMEVASIEAVEMHDAPELVSADTLIAAEEELVAEEAAYEADADDSLLMEDDASAESELLSATAPAEEFTAKRPNLTMVAETEADNSLDLSEESISDSTDVVNVLDLSLDDEIPDNETIEIDKAA